MKSTGIVRKVDELGRIVLPKELRKMFDIDHKDPIEIYVDGDCIVLKKHKPSCIFCNAENDCIEFENQTVCKSCIEKMQMIKQENKEMV